MTNAPLISPCTVNAGIVYGPRVNLHDNIVNLEDSKIRIQNYDQSIQKQIEINRYKNKDKTPLSVKIAGGIALLAVIIRYLKCKFKKFK